MPKINVYLPDELAEAVKASGVPVSAICQRALEQAVRRVTAIREAALGELDDDPTARLTRFTRRARDAVRLALRRAEEQGAAEVGTAHLLAGLLAEGGNLAVRLLPTLEIEPAEVARQLDALPVAAGTAENRRFSAHAAAALELAVTEATSLGHNYIGGEHLLLGLIAEPEGAAGRVLRGLGAELRLTRRSIGAALTGFAHQRAQAPDGLPPAAAEALSAAVRAQLQPLVERIDRLEQRMADRSDAGA